jgi:hypothetical protein
MYKPLNKAGKRLAQAAVLTLAITGISAPSFALDETAYFQIEVQEAENPCAIYQDIPATWMPDTLVSLTDLNNNSNTGFGSIVVDQGADVGMTVPLNFESGLTCNVDEAPSGEVSAAWTLPLSSDISLDLGSYNCVDSPCSAANVSSIDAIATIAFNAMIGTKSGSVFIEWTPADNSTP